jgi:triacylglycerol lipase
MSAAATDVDSIGSMVTTASRGAASATTKVLAAAQDEVSAAIAALFGEHGQAFQAATAQATAFHEKFVQTLAGAGSAYAAAEVANASPLAAFEQALQGVQQEVQNLPTLSTLATGFNQQLDFFFTSPSSPLFAQLTGDNPLLSIGLSNSPPRLLTSLLGETVQYTTYDGMRVVQITPAHPTGEYVVAIHGGAFIFAPSIFHWLNYTVSAYQTGATYQVPIYPLLQQGGTAGVVVPQMAGLISQQIGLHGYQNVSVTGDSAGGNLALAAVQYMVQNPQLGHVPSAMVLVSPWLDLESTGGQLGKIWANDLSVTDPMVSPLFGSLDGLPPTYVYSGSQDPLEASAYALQQAAIAHEVPMSFVFENGGAHDWVLLSWRGLPYWPQINQQLGIA